MQKSSFGATLSSFFSFAVGGLLAGCASSLPALIQIGDIASGNKIASDNEVKVEGLELDGQQQATQSGGLSQEDRTKIKDDFKEVAKDIAASASTNATTTIIVQQPPEQVSSFRAIGPHVWTGDMLVKTGTGSYKITGVEPLAFAATDDTLVVAASVSGAVRGFALTETVSGYSLIQEWAEVTPFNPGESPSSAALDAQFNLGRETRDLVGWDEAGKRLTVIKEGQELALYFSITWGPFGLSKDAAANRFKIFGENAVFAFKDGKKWWYAVAEVGEVTASAERKRWPITPVADGLGEPRYIQKIGQWLYTHSWDEDLKRFVLWRVDKKELKRQLK